jgi:hypothetical protein
MNDRERLASRYVKTCFEATDRLAVVLINKRTSSVTQRIASAETIASDRFQAWLRHQNSQRNEVYISMNALQPDARGRTKADVAVIRHIYLDFDANGTECVRQLFQRRDMPVPSHVINSSPDKWQVTWRVQGFAKEKAEVLQRALARETGADPAATDCARVLRLPGFFNHKYARPHLVRVEPYAAREDVIYGPEHFPQVSVDERSVRHPFDPTGRIGARKLPPGHLSQSERDWAFAKRALARGEPEEVVIAAIASHRRYDKPNPRYYAEHTVQKAAETLRLGPLQRGGTSDGPER